VKGPELKYAHVAPEVWEALGKLERTGWVNRKVSNPETVKDHTIALRIIASNLEGLTEEEKDGLLGMLEVHDWPEAIHGDEVVISDDEAELKLLRATKFDKEKAALTSICEKIEEKGQEIMNLWLRFETSNDPAAELARQLDKYQAIEKALEYEKAQGIPLFKEFFGSSKKKITHPILIKKLEDLKKEWNLNR
jgi:5'-deoxynucleotidase YfbR-like HD superfamily hydrolase